MTTLLPDIKSNNWQISTAGVGLIAEGLEDIRQCLDICLRTTKGTDPLRPQFGSDIYQYVDKPVSVAIPNIVRSIIEAVEIWEKRVTINRVRYQQISSSKVDFFLTYRLVDEELIDLLKLQLNGGFITVQPTQLGTLTIYALFPPNIFGKRYNVSLDVNGTSAMPVPPPSGFATIDEMYNWITINWSGYGSWQKSAFRITGFLKPGIVTASLSIILIGTLKYSAAVPNVIPGQQYSVAFSPNGTALPAAGPFHSIGEMLTWLNTNYGSYGSWNIEVNPHVGGDFDPGDFSNQDFNTSISATYVLTLSSDTVVSATLVVTAV